MILSVRRSPGYDMRVPLRVYGHSLRWGMTERSRVMLEKRPESGDPRYDPFDPKGPWTAECGCGWTAQVETKQQGIERHRQHKQAVIRAGGGTTDAE